MYLTESGDKMFKYLDNNFQLMQIHFNISLRVQVRRKKKTFLLNKYNLHFEKKKKKRERGVVKENMNESEKKELVPKCL